MSHVYEIFGVSGKKCPRRRRRRSLRLSLSLGKRLKKETATTKETSPDEDGDEDGGIEIEIAPASQKENEKNATNDDFDSKCPVCGIDYSSFTWLDKEVHIDACFERAEGKDAEVLCAPQSSHGEENDIRGEKYQCPICGKGFLKEQKLHVRLDHLKSCANAHGVTAREFASNQDSGDEAFDLLIDALTPPDPCPDASPSPKPTINASMLDYFPRVPASVNAALMKGAKRQRQASKKKARAIKGKGKQKRTRRTRGWCPPFKKIPNTSFIVDGFHYPCASTKYYFLSHFHSDHYGGLDGSFDAGTVVCNGVTSRLIQSQLGVKRDRILVLEEKVVTRIGVHSVVALPANHCPGACVFLFFTSPSQQVHFHTGDFRYCDAVRDSVRSFLGERRIDTLLLDTTYADPKYSFPPQKDCIDAACERLLRIASSEKVLVVFGTYSIGKERLFMEAVRRFDQRRRAEKAKIAVTASKMRILRQLDWSLDNLGRFTTQKNVTRFWVVPMSQLRFDALENHLRTYRRYTSVVAVRPTGWSFSSKQPKASSSSSAGAAAATLSTRRNKLGSVTVLSVPYSEHSSFSELKRCVADFKPRRIVPTVNNKSKESTRAMVRLLCDI